jgi:hypothetical protein
MALGYSKITGLNGLEDNIGGITKRAWWCPERNFTTIEAVLDFTGIVIGTTADELVEITEDHVHPVGEGFIEVYNTRDAGEVKGNTVGERDGRGSKMSGNVFVPGLNPLKLGNFRMMKNDSGIWLFEMADGIVIQLGSKRFPTEQMLEIGTAKNESGVRGTKITVDSFESFITIYSGTITIKTP